MIVDTHTGRLRFAANLKWMFTELPFEQRFDAAAQAGFTGVEFASPYGLPAQEVRRLLDAAGLRQVLINTPAGAAGSPTEMGAACVPNARAEFRDGVHTAIEYAATLGAPIIHVMCGLRPADVDPMLSFSHYVANIGWAAEQARSAGVRIVLEPLNKRDQPRYGLDSMEAAAAVAAATDIDTVGVLFDVFHAQVDGGNLLDRFDQLASSIAHVQIADNPGRAEPGTGEIAYERVLPAIAASGYTGWIGCEYRPQTSSRDSLGWIERIRA